jgi:outer membrane immunogenic protein
MRLAALASTALCLGLGAAQAAPPPPVLDPWVGFYAGGNIGYSWGHIDIASSVGPFEQRDNVPPFFQFLFPGGATSSSLRVNGPIGGLQVGQVSRVAPNWLGGIELDFQLSGEKASGQNGFFGGTPNCTSGRCSFLNTGDITAQLSYFGTLRGRTGPEINGLWFYVTAGAAWGRVAISATNSLALFNNTQNPPALVGAFASATSYSQTLAGPAAGIGVEGLVLGSPNLRWKLEYLHIDLGRLNGAVFGTTPLVTISSARFTDDIVRTGISYRFTGGP